MHRIAFLALSSLTALILTLCIVSQTSSQPTPAETEPAPSSTFVELTKTFGLSEKTMQNMASLMVTGAMARAEAAYLDETIETYEQDIAASLGAARVWRSQVEAAPQRRGQRIPPTFSLVTTLTERSLSSARVEVMKRRRARSTALADLIDTALEERALIDTVVEQTKEQQRQEEERVRKEASAKNAQAQAELAKVQEQRRLATTTQLKEILGQQEEQAKRVVALTAKKPQVSSELTQALSQAEEAFTTRRDEVNVFVDQLPREVPESDRVSRVDPVFESVRRERHQLRQAFFQANDTLRTLEKSAEAEKVQADRAVDRLEEAQEEQKSGETELGKARIELARAEAHAESMESEIAILRVEQHVALKALIRQRLDFFNVALEKLLPFISSTKRSEYYSITRDENWIDAQHGTRLAVIRVSKYISDRVEEVFEFIASPSVSGAAWIGGFVLRALILMAILFVLRSRGSSFVRRITDWALKQRTFRTRPGATIKAGEVVRHILSPLALFAALTYLIDYIEIILPEASYAQWVVNAVFIFRLTTIIVSVMVLPRTVREPEKLLTQPGEGFGAPVSADGDGIDVVQLEISRARKLVRSAKVVIWFWLLVVYVPELIVALMGHSIVWRLVDIATTWGFILVIYSVLSTWKDDIARIFERVAPQDLERAVAFVNANKDKVWGVLVIAGASVYVFIKEGARLGRRYLVETEWSKRISNFVFRKRVEYQQRDKNAKEANDPETLDASLSIAALPSHYLALFEDHPLTDEIYLVERSSDLSKKVATKYDSWKKSKRQGSVALIGETGIGKTTELHTISHLLEQRCAQDATQIVSATVRDKMTTKDDVISLLVELFGLTQTPETKTELIRALLDAPEHVIVLDDCHHLFLRFIGGFEGLELFLEIVNLTDSTHFWVLSFSKFAWSYLARVKRREHYFGAVLHIEPWSGSEIEDLIWKRSLMTGCKVEFDDLVVTRDEGEDISYEVIKSAKGYFRLLHEFCQGNPRVALIYWLRSLKMGQDPETMQVGLFRTPPERVTALLADNYWFTLTALAQHTSLDALEISKVINADEGFCEMALNYFEEMEVVTMDSDRRARLDALYLRQVLKHLADSNYLYE